MPELTHPQRNIIWREWRHCGDKEYAERLYDLVADYRVGWGVRLSILLFDLMAGAMVGVVIGFATSNSLDIIRMLAVAGTVAGGVKGVLTGIYLTWREWMRRLAFSLPSEEPINGVAALVGLGLLGSLLFGPLFFIGLIGLFWGLTGLIERAIRSVVQINPYEYHVWYFWWRGRPTRSELTTALQQANISAQEMPQYINTRRTPKGVPQ